MFQNLSLSDALLLVSTIGPFVLTLAGIAYHALFALLPAQQQATIRARVAEVVAAVDQANAAVPGAQKKQLATLLLNEVATKFKVPAQTLDTLIEAAVSDLRMDQAQAGYTRLPTLAATPAPTTGIVVSGFMPSGTGGDPVTIAGAGTTTQSTQPAPAV